MKKAKIMLLTITVLAVVGGALAFKVRTIDQVDICTTDPDPIHGCAGLVPNGCTRKLNLSAVLDVINRPNFCYTTTFHDFPCGDDCTYPATIEFGD